jgi:ribosome recycling factor
MIDEILFEAEERMELAVEVAKDDFAAIRTGRATASLFAKVVVDYYGTPTPIPQISSVQTPDPRLVVIKPYEAGQLRAIEEAIQKSDLGLNPSNDGQVVRVAIPALTEERRKEFAKQARGKAEEARVTVRNVRRKANEQLGKLSKEGQAGEDDVARAEKELDKLTAKFVGVIDELVKKKEAELLEV